MATSETLIVTAIGIVRLMVVVVPVVLLVILWRRNARLKERVDALERRLGNGA